MLLEQSIVFSKKKLPACISQQLGMIPCLPKGYKPRQFLKKKNLRPITLLNVLYKIISGCLSLRI